MLKKRVAIGKARGRPVFPDYETGKQSMRLLLKEDFYQRLTLNQLPKKYTGVPIEAPDTEEVEIYRRAIRVQTKFDMERTVKSLNEEEYEKLLKAMETHEGWQVRDMKNLKKSKKLLGLRMNKKRVISRVSCARHKRRTMAFKRCGNRNGGRRVFTCDCSSCKNRSLFKA